ncbi:MAG: hypothetical protein HC796_05325 [Synechococcaceae cyanobacterium RL_1_2]|nr:hypothetical protein [Synechococcaceae cyanobacterium RL_1_2]
MNTNFLNCEAIEQDPFVEPTDPKELELTQDLELIFEQELTAQVESRQTAIKSVSARIAKEVTRICEKSQRIQRSGEIRYWELSLGRQRIQKCLHFYKLGSKKARVELHNKLSVIVYRYIAPSSAHLGFNGRYNLIEDFLQDFYAESLKLFRREHHMEEEYQPRGLLALAEYMAFTEQYAKRRIHLRPGYSQQLIILRAQTFARRLPKEAVVDIEQATEFSKGEDGGDSAKSSLWHELRQKLVADVDDGDQPVIRDRLLNALYTYLTDHGYQDCADYLTLKLEDLTASEIDEILNITPRQRDYLQQRFKYHVEKFARSSHWELVHQWLGADLDHRLGMTYSQWEQFHKTLEPVQQQILELKRAKELSDRDIAKTIGLTLKKIEKQWSKILEQAWQIRNEPS